MPRKIAESNNVAYFDHPDQVDEPGFYVVEGGHEEQHPSPEQDMMVYHDNGPDTKIGRRVYPHPDGEGWTFTAPNEVDEEDEG